MARAIYAGTFDPITFGHIDIIERSTQIFDEIIIAVALNNAKNTLFTLEERLEMVEIELKINKKFAHKNIRCEGFNTLLVDFAKMHNSKVIIRGIRAISDFEYEFQMSSMNQRLNNNVQTILLPSSERTHFISSKFVKDIAKFKGDISSLVPEDVKIRLEKLF